jgi:hypothetical protein
MVELCCRDCPHWYGSEDDGFGPCTIKSQREARRPLTYGGHACDEGYAKVASDVVFVGKATPRAAARPPPAEPRRGSVAGPKRKAKPAGPRGKAKSAGPKGGARRKVGGAVSRKRPRRKR